MDYTAEEKAIVWLAACSGLDAQERTRLLKTVPDVRTIAEDYEKILPSVIKEERKRLYNSNRTAREEQLNAFLKELDGRGYFAVTLCSEDYPRRLAKIPFPPLVLYGKGKRELLKTRMFCIVGSRITPPWAAELTKKIAGDLSRHFTVVTGLAEGGDGAAIEGALAGGKLISVLPNGLNECYPASHASVKEKIAKTGLLLSEYLPGESARQYSFHARNRILAGLSEGVLVVSAGAKSGTAITAQYAGEYSRQVFAFPYNPGVNQGVGCNALIQKGAALVTCADDILSVYGLQTVRKEDVELSPEEERCLAVIRDGGELHISLIAERAHVQIFEAAALLSSLEMKGLVVKAGGNRFSAL